MCPSCFKSCLTCWCVDADQICSSSSLYFTWENVAFSFYKFFFCFMFYCLKSYFLHTVSCTPGSPYIYMLLVVYGYEMLWFCELWLGFYGFLEGFVTVFVGVACRLGCVLLLLQYEGCIMHMSDVLSDLYLQADCLQLWWGNKIPNQLECWLKLWLVADT